MPPSRTFRFAVVGATAGACRARQKLRERGNIVDDFSGGRCRSVYGPLVFAGSIDNYTRIHRAHQTWAKELYGWTQGGFSSISENLKNVRKFDLVRLAQTADQTRELQIAWEMLDKWWPVALEGAAAGDFLRQKELQQVLQCQKPWESDLHASTTNPLLSEDIRIFEKSDSVEIQIGDGEPHTYDGVIVADRYTILRNWPHYRDSLPYVAEQVCEINSVTDLSEDYDFHIAQHGNIWWHQLSKRRIRMGGGRYLRPVADLHAEPWAVSSRISAHLLKIAKEHFGRADLSVAESAIVSNCYPCDELPMVGATSLASRVFFCTGFWGWSAAMEYACADRLIDLIMSGKITDLLSALSPRRFRSLEDS
jgi:hypothetical protein